MTRLLVLLTSLLVALSAAADSAADKQFDFAQGAYIQQDYLTAIEEFTAFLKRYPDDDKAPHARLRLARSHLRLEQYEEAVDAYKAALKHHPQHDEAPQAHFDLARAYTALARTEEALPHYAAAVEEGQGELRQEAMIGRGECLTSLEQLAPALTVYEAFLKAYPSSAHVPGVLFTTAWIQHQLGDHRPAMTRLQRLLDTYPDYPQLDKARLLLSDASSAAGDYDGAAAALKELLGDETQGAAATLRLGWTVYRQGDKQEAARIFADFAKRYPRHEQAPSALYNAAVALYETRLFSEAAATCAQLRQAYPQTPSARDSRLWQGLSLFEAKHYEETITVLAPLLDSSDLPTDQAASAHYAVAAARDALGHEQASEAYRQLLDRYPASAYAANATYSLARLVGETGDRDTASALLRDLLAKDPPQQLADLAHFALGEHLFFLEQYEEALTQLTACQLSGDDAHKVQLRLGWTQFRLQQHEEAQATFERLAGQSSPLAAEAAYMAGRAAEEAGELDQARRHYLQLADNGEGTYAEKAHYALVFLLAGDEARQRIESYLKHFPNGQHETDLLLKLAELELADNQIEAAATRYRQLAQRDLDDMQRRTVHYGLGWCHLKQDQLDQADAAFAKVTYPPADTTAHDARQQRGEIAFRQQRYADALTQFAPLTELETARAERALYMVGWSNRHLDQEAAAEAAFRQLLDRFPQGDLAGDAALRLAELLHARGDHQDALQLIDASAAQVEPPEDMLHLQGELLVAREQWKRLIEQSKALKTAFPDSKRLYLADFRLGLAYRAAGLLDQAEASFNDTIAATNTIEAAKAQFNIGTLYMTRQQPLEAGKQFLRVELLYDYPELSPKALYHATAAFLEAEGADSRRAAIYRDKLSKDYAGSEWATKAEALFAGRTP